MSETLHNILFPEYISYGMSATWGFNNTLVTSLTGDEIVQRGWSKVKHSYSFSSNQTDIDAFRELKEFYLNRNGEVYRFLFKDWLDYKVDLAADFFIDPSDYDSNNIADLSDYAITKTYTDSGGYSYIRNITRAKVSVIDAIKEEGSAGYYTINGEEGSDLSDGTSYLTAYRLCAPEEDDILRDPSMPTGLHIFDTDTPVNYVLSHPIINFDMIGPPYSSLKYAIDNPTWCTLNYVFLKFRTTNPNDDRYIRIEVYYSHTQSYEGTPGYTLNYDHLPLKRQLVPPSGQFYYGQVCTSGNSLVANPETSYCYYRDDSPGREGNLDSAYWDGDCFCYRVICYTSVDGDWHGNDDTGEPTTGCTLIWQSYTPWIQLVYKALTEYTIPKENDAIEYVPGDDPIMGKKVIDIEEFYVPARFSIEEQSITYDAYNNLNWKNIKVVESGI